MKSVSTTRTIKVLDFINTAASAKQLLLYRVGAVNQQAGFENWIACGPGPDVESLRKAGIPVAVIDSPRGISLKYLSPKATIVSFVRLIRFIRKHRFCMVHTHGPVQGAIGRIAAWLARVPVIVHTEHGSIYHENQHPVARRFYMWIEGLLALITDHLLFVAAAEHRYAIDHGLTGRASARVIGDGINLADFTRERNQKRRPDGNPNTVIIAVARLDPVKNVPMLLRAVDRLRRTHPDFECRILGDGICRADLVRFVQERDLGSHVRFLGHQDDVADQLAASDIAVLTSVKEGLPRGLMEPMAIGLPVVATDVKGNCEVVVDGECGFLVPLDDDDALARKLALLIDDPVLRARVGEKGKRRARQYYDEAEVIRRSLRMYRELLSVNPRTMTELSGDRTTSYPVSISAIPEVEEQ